MVRRFAFGWRLLDIPNRRSAHVAPIPRGGGLAIVIVFLIGAAFATLRGDMTASDLIAIGAAGGLVAVVGLLDDRFQLPAGWRLLAHFLAAGWLMTWLPVVSAGGLVPRGVTIVVAAVAVVWLLNLYNFMDGIDGIAGVETVTVCLGIVVLSGGVASVWLGPALLAAATAGFLVWNLPPARIFMGDVGSGFLGLILGAFALQAASVSSRLTWSWIILLAVFITDATLTLLARALRGRAIA